MQCLPLRLFSAFIAIWLAVVLAEPAALHVCPEHDASAYGTSATAQAHESKAHVHGEGTEAAEPSSHHADTPASHQCACLGHCLANSAAGSPRVAPVETGDLLFLAVAIARPESRFSPPATPFLLPFANGPPRMA